MRITTGFVEPHFFAGFSGGPKLVAPGLAGLETVLTLHDAKRIGDPRATWAVCEGNPVHDDIRAVVAAVGRVDFALDVVLNREQRIVEAFGGALSAMHAAARAASQRLAMQPVPRAVRRRGDDERGLPARPEPLPGGEGDVGRGAGGAGPAARSSARPSAGTASPTTGRTARCWPPRPSPQALLATIAARERTVPDQWQVQVQAKVQAHASVVVRTVVPLAADLASAHLGHTEDVAETVLAALHAAGPDARVCVLPEGPQTIPYVG